MRTPDAVDLIRLTLAWKEYRRRYQTDTLRPQDKARMTKEIWNIRHRFKLMDPNDIFFFARALGVDAQEIVAFDTLTRPPAKRPRP